MTINSNCLIEKYAICEDSQAQQENACRNSGDHNAINKCISNVDREFERCKDQAERDCEIQDTTIVPKENTTPPPTKNITHEMTTATEAPHSPTKVTTPPPKIKSQTTTPPPPSLPSSPTPLPLLTTPTPAQRGLSQGDIAAISIGAVVALICLCAGVGASYYLYKGRKDIKPITTMGRRGVDGAQTPQAKTQPVTPFSARSPVPPGVVEGYGGMRYPEEQLREAAIKYKRRPDHNKLLLLEYTGGDLPPDLAAEQVLLELGDHHKQQPISSTTTPKQKGPMGAAGGGAVDHGDDKLNELGPASPATDNPVSNDHEIPGDVKICLNEIISKLEEDLKATTSVIKTQPMITPPNQELVSNLLPDNPNQKVGQEGDDSPRAARGFWEKMDREAGKGNTLEFTTPEASPTKSAAVSPGMSGGHQV